MRVTARGSSKDGGEGKNKHPSSESCASSVYRCSDVVEGDAFK